MGALGRRVDVYRVVVEIGRACARRGAQGRVEGLTGDVVELELVSWGEVVKDAMVGR